MASVSQFSHKHVDESARQASEATGMVAEAKFYRTAMRIEIDRVSCKPRL